MRITYKQTRILPAILCVLLTVLFMLGVNFTYRSHTAASAAESEYTILDDFADTDMDMSEYPENPTDNSLEIIQLAETTDATLVVYVYQPNAKRTELNATSINISVNNAAFTRYTLELMGSSDTIFKYTVKDLNIPSEQVRTYSISSISRNWLKDIDKPTGSDNTVSTVAISVGQKWTAVTTSDGNVEYYCTKDDVIEITDKYVGFLRYSNGFKLFPDSCDSHYVAFSTDIPIDYLYDADVEFEYLRYALEVCMDEKPIPETVKLSDMDTASNKADGWFAEKHEWNRIESVDMFIANEELTDSAKLNLRNKQWVLRFKETNYMRSMNKDTYTAISDVSILRLKFKSNGVVYDIGVVDNKQSGTTTPGNTDTSWLPDWLAAAIMWIQNYWYWIVVGIVGIVLLIIIMPFMPLILQAIVTLFTWLFKGLWWLISAPFKWIYRKIKGE